MKETLNALTVSKIQQAIKSKPDILSSWIKAFR